MSDLLELYTTPSELAENVEKLMVVVASESQQTCDLSKPPKKSLPLKLLQTTMASAMAGIIGRMTNKNYQGYCMSMLDAIGPEQMMQNLLSLLKYIDNGLAVARKIKRTHKAKNTCAVEKSTSKKQDQPLPSSLPF